MPDHVDSVKALLRLYDRWKMAAEEKGEEKQAATYVERMAAMQGVVDELEHLRRVTKPIPASYGDLSDLPPELVKELTGIKVDDLEQQLFTIIKTGADEVDLDAILIELYRRFKVIQTRKFLQNKLWRMAQKGVISSVQGRKGVYTARSQSNGNDDGDNIVWPPPSQPNPFDSDLDEDVPF